MVEVEDLKQLTKSARSLYNKLVVLERDTDPNDPNMETYLKSVEISIADVRGDIEEIEGKRGRLRGWAEMYTVPA